MNYVQDQCCTTQEGIAWGDSKKDCQLLETFTKTDQHKTSETLKDNISQKTHFEWTMQWFAHSKLRIYANILQNKQTTSNRPADLPILWEEVMTAVHSATEEVRTAVHCSTGKGQNSCTQYQSLYNLALQAILIWWQTLPLCDTKKPSCNNQPVPSVLVQPHDPARPSFKVPWSRDNAEVDRGRNGLQTWRSELIIPSPLLKTGLGGKPYQLLHLASWSPLTTSTKRPT